MYTTYSYIGYYIVTQLHRYKVLLMKLKKEYIVKNTTENKYESIQLFMLPNLFIVDE